MLHVFLLILKIIGIIIAVLLGLAIALLLIVLFVPIRYRIDADCHDKTFKAHVRITWILHIFRAVLDYDKELSYSIKALWFNIYSSNDKQEPEQITKDKKQKKSKRSKTESDSSKSKDKKAKSIKDKDSNINDNKVKENDFENNEIQDIKRIENNQDSVSDITDDVQEKYCLHDIEGIKSAENNDVNDDTGMNIIYTEADNADGQNEKLSNNSDSNILIHSLVKKIKSVYYRIKSLIIGAYNTVKAAINKSQEAADKIKTKYSEFREKVTDPENIELMKFLWAQVKALINIIRPVKYNVNVRYGFEDSSITGWLAVRLAVLYGFIGMDVNIIPDFDNSIFEGDIDMKGRFNLFSILIIALRLYKNKSFRRVINR